MLERHPLFRQTIRAYGGAQTLTGSAFRRGAAISNARCGKAAHCLYACRIVTQVRFRCQNRLPDFGRTHACRLRTGVRPGPKIRPVGDKRRIERILISAHRMIRRKEMSARANLGQGVQADMRPSWR